eukprot:1148277-Pelagomonas_calceolata.AAC.5
MYSSCSRSNSWLLLLLLLLLLCTCFCHGWQRLALTSRVRPGWVPTPAAGAALGGGRCGRRRRGGREAQAGVGPTPGVAPAPCSPALVCFMGPAFAEGPITWWLGVPGGRGGCAPPPQLLAWEILSGGTAGGLPMSKRSGGGGGPSALLPLLSLGMIGMVAVEPGRRRALLAIACPGIKGMAGWVIYQKYATAAAAVVAAAA